MTKMRLALPDGMHFIKKEKKAQQEKAEETHFQDSSLFFKVFVLIRLCIRKVVDLDSMLIDLIQNLGKRKCRRSHNNRYSKVRCFIHSVIQICFGQF